MNPGPFAVADGCLLVGGVSVTRLAERVGGTPFYAYDRGLIEANVGRLRAALPAPVRLHFSLKANPMPAVAQHLARLVDGFDVASARELATALDTGVAADAIGFAGPGKLDHELAMAVAAGVVIHLESEGELRRVARQGARLGLTPRVALRVNPDFELKLSAMRMSGGAKPFGVDAERAPALLRAIAGAGLAFEGLHIYCGSQSLNPHAIAEAQEGALRLAMRLAEAAPAPARLLNIGGGFGIPYFAGERELDLAPIADRLRAVLPQLRARLPGARVVIELGRYLVGNAGVYVTRVIDRKLSRGKVFLVTDGGMNHHLAASGNLGQKIRRNYPVVIANKMAAKTRATQTVVGPLCTPLDVLAEDVALPPGRAGDLVAVLQSGAYGPSASPTGFLGHAPPREVLL